MTDVTVTPLHNRQAVARYVDLRLGLIDGIEHTIDTAIDKVSKGFGREAARYAASVCDNRPVEQVIEARKARPDDFKKRPRR